MSYDPDAKVDRFIRESVLEEKNVDFTKLIEAKENIERLNNTFRAIGEEVDELEKILEKYDEWDVEKNRFLMDDIKIVYKKKTELESSIAVLEQKQQSVARRKEQLADFLHTIEKRSEDVGQSLVKARVNLQSLDCMQAIAGEEERLARLKEEKHRLAVDLEDLKVFQIKVSEMIHMLEKEGDQGKRYTCSRRIV